MNMAGCLVTVQNWGLEMLHHERNIPNENVIVKKVSLELEMGGATAP